MICAQGGSRDSATNSNNSIRKHQMDEAALQKKLDLKLKDFAPDQDANKNWSDLSKWNPVELKPESVPSPYIVYIIFVVLKDYSHGGRWEKVAWEIPIQYKGEAFMLSHRKFGFQIQSVDGTLEQAQLAQEAIFKIGKATSVAEDLLQPMIRSQIDLGEITLVNDYHHLRARYEYFRACANEQLAEVREPKIIVDDSLTIHENLNAKFASYNRGIKRKQRAGYYAMSMIDAYFSLLEHILVLVKPFVHLKGTESSLADFIRSNWGSKFKAIFNTGSNPSANQIYSSLLSIKETYRNPSAHGNFLKQGGSLYVHIPRVGAVPMHMSKSKDDIRYSFRSEQELADVCSILDAVDAFLESSITSFGMIYVKSGAEVAYDTQSKKKYAVSMIDKATFEQFVDQVCREIDDNTNMDW